MPIDGELGLRYEVESKNSPDMPHTVDLSWRNGFGQCDCIDWQTRRWPNIRDGIGHMHTEETACKHVRASLHYFLKRALWGVIELHGQHREED